VLRAALALLLALAAFGSSPAQAQRRLALVIGIAEYQHLPKLRRPVGDAQAVQEALFAHGVEADVVVEVDRTALEAAVGRFAAKLRQGDVALVHFTGHGARIGGEFVLLPSDAPPQDAPDEEVRNSGALGLTALARRLDATGARAQILVVDACRGEPYEEAGAPLSASSCGPVGAPLPEGTFVLFSAGDGQRALDRLGPDDQDPHSVFTRTLLRLLPERPDLAALARDVQGEVETSARGVSHDQRPAVIEALQGRGVSLGGKRPNDVASIPAPRRPPAPEPPRLPEPAPPQARLPAPAPEPPVARLPDPPPSPRLPEPREQRDPLREREVPREREPVREREIVREPVREREVVIEREVVREREPPVARLPIPDLPPQPPARRDIPEPSSRFNQPEPPVARLPTPDVQRDRPPVRTARPFLCGSAAPGSPSFDCRYARSTTEIAVCRDPRLGSCDRVLNDMFERAQERLRGPGLRREQDTWLLRREACRDFVSAGPEALAECIGRTYDRRIVELQELASAPPPRRPAPPRVEAYRPEPEARAQPSRGPSFNCRYARTPVEEAVCSEPALAAKDREMSALYYRTLGSEPGRAGSIETTQNNWRAARDACARRGGRALSDCVDEAYEARIRDLRGYLASR
jgi:uncharacterized protein